MLIDVIDDAVESAFIDERIFLCTCGSLEVIESSGISMYAILSSSTSLLWFLCLRVSFLVESDSFNSNDCVVNAVSRLLLGRFGFCGITRCLELKVWISG